MKYAFSLSLVLCFCLTSIAWSSVDLREAIISAYPGASEIEVSYPEDLRCSLDTVPTTSAQLFYYLSRDCSIKVSELSNSSVPKLILYTEDGLFSPISVTYSKTGGTIYDLFYRYFPAWELHGDAVSEITLLPAWRSMTISALAKELSTSYFVRLDHEAQYFYVLEKKTTPTAPKTYYSLLYPFEDLNLDLYELFKGYFLQTGIVQYTRDGNYYLKLSASESSRESLSKMFSMLRGILDDKTMRANKLGSYFPSAEKANLNLLYAMLQKLQIKSFRIGELVEVNTASLVPQGLDKYAEIIETTSNTSNSLDTYGLQAEELQFKFQPSQIPPPPPVTKTKTATEAKAKPSAKVPAAAKERKEPYTDNDTGTAQSVKLMTADGRSNNMTSKLAPFSHNADQSAMPK